MRAREAETGRAFVTHGRRQWLEPEELETQLNRAGIDHLWLRTDEPFTTRLRQFFESRDILGKGAR